MTIIFSHSTPDHAPLSLTPPAPTLPPRRAAILTAAGLGLLFVLLLVLAARESYWLDEGYTLRRVEAAWPQVVYPFVGAAAHFPTHPFDRLEVFDLNPPLYFVLARALAGAHPGPLAIRLFSAVPMLLALLFIILYARREHGLPGQVAALLLGATAPAVIYYGHEARPYAMPLAVACLLVWLASRWRDRPLRLFAAFALGHAAGCLMHFAFCWWTLAQGLIFGFLFLLGRQSGDRAAARAALAAALGASAGALLALAVIATQWGILDRCRGASSWVLTPSVLMSAFALPFTRIGQHPVPASLGFALQLALLAAMLLLLRRSSRRAAGAVALASWLLPFLFPVIAKYWLNLAFIERYTFAALAGWLMALSWTAGEAARRRGALRFVALAPLAAALLVNVAWGARNLAHPLRAHWRPAVALLKARATGRDAYTIDPYSENHCFAANAVTPPAARYVTFDAGLLQDAEAIWVLADESSTPEWDEGRLDPRLWRVERVITSRGVDLFRITRCASADEQKK